jgi:hypothetical protein
MRKVDRAGHRGHELRGPGGSPGAVGRGLGALPQRAAGHVLHGEEILPFIPPELIHRDDVRMHQARRCFGLPPEAFQEVRRLGVHRGKNLQRHHPIETELARAIHRAHAAARDQLQDFIITKPPSAAHLGPSFGSQQRSPEAHPAESLRRGGV